MPYPTVIHLITEEFGKAKLRTILVGGFAVNFYGVSRQTADIDFLLCEADAPAAGEILLRAGYREQHRQETFARWHSVDIMLMDVDFLFVESSTFETVWSEGSNTEVGGYSLRVPSLDHLIAMKLHALKHNPVARGQKDLMDIVSLAQHNQLDMRSERYRSLCLRFGTEEIQRRILALIE